MAIEEQEYRVPVKLLTRREAIFFNRLSVLETVQWLAVGALAYLGFNLMPLDFTVKVGVLGTLVMAGMVFIHVPINGLTGIEWFFIALRYRLEEDRHYGEPPTVLSLPVFVAVTGPTVSYRLVGSEAAAAREAEIAGEPGN